MTPPPYKIFGGIYAPFNDKVKLIQVINYYNESFLMTDVYLFI